MNTPKAMRVNDAQIEKALQATGGFMSLAAQRLGCSYKTVWRRVQGSAKLQAALTEICDKKLDVAEAALMKAIGSGEAWAVCFYLKCKGKQRGYVERQELTGKDGGPIISQEVDVPDAELDKILDGH
jgi:hypothetical protein